MNLQIVYENKDYNINYIYYICIINPKSNMEDIYKVILRSIETMFSAINTNLKDGKFIGTENSIDMVKSLVDDIKSKSTTDRKAQVDSVVRDSIQMIRTQNAFIPDYINNKLNQF